MGVYIASKSSAYKSVNSLVLENIEALATGEDNYEHVCMGIGDIDCEGRKVNAKVELFSLYE